MDGVLWISGEVFAAGNEGAFAIVGEAAILAASSSGVLEGASAEATWNAGASPPTGCAVSLATCVALEGSVPSTSGVAVSEGSAGAVRAAIETSSGVFEIGFHQAHFEPEDWQPVSNKHPMMKRVALLGGVSNDFIRFDQ